MGALELQKRAKEHTRYVADYYKDDIYYSARNTALFRGVLRPSDQHKYKVTKFVYEDLSVLAAMEKYVGTANKVCVLNFASYIQPGGGFMQGANSQEEILYHRSVLYNVLEVFRGVYYDYNKQHNPRYEDTSLYTPDVLFIGKEGKFYCDVLSCTALNAKTVCLPRASTEIKVLAALKRRTSHMLYVAEKMGADILILGAWGCAEFENNPSMVASVFKSCIKEGMFDKVIFAVADKRYAEPFKRICL